MLSTKQFHVLTETSNTCLIICTATASFVNFHIFYSWICTLSPCEPSKTRIMSAGKGNVECTVLLLDPLLFYLFALNLNRHLVKPLRELGHNACCLMIKLQLHNRSWLIEIFWMGLCKDLVLDTPNTSAQSLAARLKSRTKVSGCNNWMQFKIYSKNFKYQIRK